MQPNAETTTTALRVARPLAPGTMVLFALNLSVFTLMLSDGGISCVWDSRFLLGWGANYAPLTMDDQWWRVFTCMFVHGGVLHVAFNLWILWQVGRLLEFALGTISYLVLYLTSGLCSGLAALYFHPFAVVQGASGALFGLVGGLVAVMIWHRNRMRVETVRQLRHNLLLFLGFNVMLGLAVEKIDLLGHVTGMLVGLGFGLLLAQPSTSRWVRWRRAVLVAGGAAALFWCTMQFARSAPPDVYRELAEFTAVERRCLHRYNAARERVDRGLMRQRLLLEMVDGDLLPQWRSAGEKVLAINEYPSSLAPIKPKMDTYIETRAESWQLLVDSLRQNNKRKLKLHQQQWSRAEQLARELSSEP